MSDEMDEEMQDGRATIARLAEHVVPELIERLTKSELGELEVRENGWRVRLRKPLAEAVAPPAAAARVPHPVMAPGVHVASHSSAGAPRDTARGIVASPAVGYFAPRRGIEIGAAVSSGDLLGHVDVLGVRHEVVSPVNGALREFDVESGQAVEYGQPIARVEAEA